MSDTPRTDAAFGGIAATDAGYWKALDHARELERENGAWRELSARMADEMRGLDHEFASLRDYDAALKAWKESALALNAELNEQALAKMLGGQLGRSCRKIIAERVPELIAENAALRDALVQAEITEKRSQMELDASCNAEELRQVREHAERCEDANDWLTVEITALRKDKARLDWLCTTDHWFDEPCDGKWTPKSFRAAIDAALAGKEAKP